MTSLDFSRENLDNTMNDYEPLLCDDCKNKLRVLAEPIRKRLNAGEPPKLRHINKLFLSLCRDCKVAIIKKNKG
jgi:hypothetical protein